MEQELLTRQKYLGSSSIFSGGSRYSIFSVL